MLYEVITVEDLQPAEDHGPLVLAGERLDGEHQQLGRRGVQPQHVIEEEIVQQIGADLLFGLP